MLSLSEKIDVFFVLTGGEAADLFPSQTWWVVCAESVPLPNNLRLFFFENLPLGEQEGCIFLTPTMGLKRRLSWLPGDVFVMGCFQRVPSRSS
jgi:hypothetical protein